MTSRFLALALAVLSLLGVGEYEPKPGDKAHLHFGESFETSIPAAPTLAIFELMLKEVATTGDKALEKLSVDDTIWGVENYVAVEVVKVDTGNDLAVEVRILDGVYENRTAFVLRSHVSGGPLPVEPFPEHGYSFKEKRKIMTAWLRMSYVVDSLPEEQRKADDGAAFLKAQEALFKRLKLTQDQAKAIMAEILVKKVHIGKELIENNPQAEHYVVAPSPELSPDPNYIPKIGDEAYLYIKAVYSKGEAP